MSVQIWQAQRATLPGGATYLKPHAIVGAIRAAFATAADPPLLDVRLRPAFEGYRATLTFRNEGKTPNERRRWVEQQFYGRWMELEKLTGVTLYMRREWRG